MTSKEGRLSITAGSGVLFVSFLLHFRVAEASLVCRHHSRPWPLLNEPSGGILRQPQTKRFSNGVRSSQVGQSDLANKLSFSGPRSKIRENKRNHFPYTTPKLSFGIAGPASCVFLYLK